MATRQLPFRLHVSRVSHGRAPRPSSTNFSDVSTSELGGSGETLYSSFKKEYVPELRGKRAFDVYDRMFRSNPKVRGAFLLLAMPVLSAQWYMQPFSNSEEDREIAEFVDWNLNNMHHPFLAFIKEALWCLKYAHYTFEKVPEVALWRPKRDGAHERLVLKYAKFAPRHPRTLDDEWERDNNNVPIGVWHTKTLKDGKTERVFLKRENILHYAWDSEADDPHGVSVFRSAYMSDYFQTQLYKVDAIQKERHGIGIPRVKLLPGFNKEDKRLANQIGRNLRTNEKAHVTEGPNFEVDFIEMHGQMVDALESAKHHGGEIMANILGEFTENKSAEGDKRTGSQAEVFVKALRYLGDFIRMEVNQHAIPQLVDWNFEAKGYPQLRVRRISENTEWRTMGVALRNMIEPGLITPTPELEEWLLDQMDFPPPVAAAMSRGITDRLSKNGTIGQKDKGDDENESGATNPNRQDPGNQGSGTSPSGNPTE